MFNYRLPGFLSGFSKKFNIKTMSIAATVLYVLSIVPLLAISFYNWPSADDMSLALKTHQYYSQTGNLLGTFFVAFKVGFDEYMNWMGYFFSNVMFCYSPSIIGERWYALVGFEMIAILTFGVCYFFNALFVHGFKADKYLSNIAAMITLILITQTMPDGRPRVESFYWYSGAINYLFMFGMGLFWLGLLIRCVYAADKKERTRKLLWACFWGFWMGGANYMTALEMAICSFLLIIIWIFAKTGILEMEIEGLDEGQRASFGNIWIPALVNLLGFAASCFAPGNSTREAMVEGFGPIKSIFIALHYVFDMCVNQYTRFEVIFAILLLVPVFWKMAEDIRHEFRHPIIFAIFAYGMTAASIVPPLYSLANIGAGRLVSIFYAEYILMLVLTAFYITAWVRQHIELKAATSGSDGDKSRLSATESFTVLVCALVIIFGSGLAIIAEPHYYSATSAAFDIANGKAAAYLEENLVRLDILQDESVTDAVLKPYSERPQILEFDDMNSDPSYWINGIVARYYGKNSVALSGDD